MARDFASVGRNPRCGFVFRKQEHEAREILCVVLDALGKNHAVIVLGGAASGDGAQDLSPRDSASRTLPRCLPPERASIRVSGEKTLALRQGHRMGRDGADIRERRAGSTDELHFDRQIVSATIVSRLSSVDRTHAPRSPQGILNGCKERVSRAFGDGREAASNIARGTVVMAPPRSWMAPLR